MAKQNLFIAGKPWDGVEQLEIPLNDNGKASTSEKAKFIETSSSNPAGAAEILTGKEAYVNGAKVTGEIPTYSTNTADTTKTISYKGQTSNQTQPTVTFDTDKKYLTTNLTAKAPSIYELTTVGQDAFPFDASKAQTDDAIAQTNGNNYYIQSGTLYKGGMEDMDTVIQDNGDEQSIFTLRADNPETGKFVNLYSRYGKRVYVGSSNNNQSPVVSAIANDSNFIPRNIVDGVTIFGLTGKRVIPAVDWKDEAKGILSIS